MIDFEARRVIEALRSGVPSRAVGEYFSSARREMTDRLSDRLENVCETKRSGGVVISGKYGEGKTHLLNTVFNMAHRRNMVVSTISLSKETPFDKSFHVYAKLMHNTYLPERLQPGFEHILQNITPNSPIALELLAFTAKHLETDKLYYLLRAYLSTEDTSERFLLQADLEGDFLNNNALKQIYRRIFNEKVKYSQTFAKTKHMDDYFTMLSHLFLRLGYKGWVILFDETELIGRLGKKTRLNAYKNMASFLYPEQFSRLEATFSIFALSASYVEDVVETKHEYENLDTASLDAKSKEAIEKVLKTIVTAEQLQPLSKSEITAVFNKVCQFHGKAYEWQPQINIDELLKSSESRGYLLRTRIRAAVEFLDQLYQYGQASNISIHELNNGTYDEDLPDLEELLT